MPGKQLVWLRGRKRVGNWVLQLAPTQSGCELERCELEKERGARTRDLSYLEEHGLRGSEVDMFKISILYYGVGKSRVAASRHPKL